MGAFLIGDTRPSRFSSRHVELIEALSAQAAVAIHNAQLVARERRAMEEHAAKLESEVHERTAELERRNQELSRIATDLQTLHHELTEAQMRQMLTEERSRIAQELHDRVQQTLFTIGLKADWKYNTYRRTRRLFAHYTLLNNLPRWVLRKCEMRYLRFSRRNRKKVAW